jgi:hypothetical protein
MTSLLFLFYDVAFSLVFFVFLNFEKLNHL